GWHADGGFAEFAVVPAAFAYAIPAVFGDVEAAPLLCAGIIGFRALERAAVPAGGRLGLWGFGSSAHVTLQISRARGARVYVLTREPSHRELARALGAVWTGDLGDVPPEPLDSAIVFAPVGELVPVALQRLARGGTLALAGIYMTPTPPLDYMRDLFYERQVRSVTANTRADGEALLAEAARIPVRLATTTFALTDANRALSPLERDYLLGSGPMLLGHAHPAVVDAVQRQMARGTSYFIVNEPAIRLAEEIVAAVPCAEQVRYTASGSEATFFALRVSRAYRQRDKIMKFEGGFHGTHDYVLMSVVPRSPKAFPAPMADSAGIPHVIDGEVLIAPYNDLATTEALIDTHHDELAAVIIEPYQRTIPPAPGFLEGLRRATQRHGVPLVFDEIVTGFRFAYGGAQEFYKVVPDLAAFGKVVAGGFPLACIAGPTAIMRHFDAALDGTPDYVWQAGTFNGNAIAAAAGLATLAELRKPGTYERLFQTGARLKAGLQAAVTKHGVAAQVSGEPPVFDLFFTDRPDR